MRGWWIVSFLPIDKAGKASDAEKYFNLRAVVWCTAADMFADGDVELKNVEPQLRGQLATPTYEFRNGRILIESKADIKQRLGRSPDRADAYVNGLYALQFVEGELVGGRDGYEGFEDEGIYGGRHSAMAM